MTEKEYLNRIECLRENLTAENAETASKELDELFNIKPVRLIWFVAKAEAMLKLGFDFTTIFNFMSDKIWYIYNYNGLDEMSNVYSYMNMAYNDVSDAKRNKFNPWICFGKPYQKYNDEINAEFESLDKIKDEFLDNTESNESLLKLQDGYFITANYVCYCLAAYLLTKRNIGFIPRNFINSQPNFGFLDEYVNSDEYDTIIIAVSENDTSDCEVAATILSMLGKKVFLIDKPIECPVDYEIDMRDTVGISLENAQDNEGVIIISPVDIILNGKSIGDNRAEIIDYVIKEYTDKKFAAVLCSGALMDDLRERDALRKQMQRLSNFMSDGTEEYLAFGWAGSYMSYISMIYGIDAQKAIEAPAECEFSIVIPARNSAVSLRHTIKTCLNQRFKGSYEIVVSDNSTNGNTAVYDLCKELNDPKIKYYKTPRDLHLPKSFEYAYLMAKGEFIFAIGSDDGVLPWGLEALSKVLKENPNDEIIQWDRGFYVWPGFNNGQANQFIIPKCYKKDNIVYEKSSPFIALLAAVNENKDLMYLMPMLYINSGFRRSYFETLLDKTGYLWNGICQDIYIGVINSIINKEVLNINYPITIAGMTSSSEGFNANKVSDNVADEAVRMADMYKTNNIGGFSMSKTERLLPEISTDTSSLFNSLLRAVTIGIISMDKVEQLADWKKMLKKLAGNFRYDDIMLDKKLHYFRFTAAKHGEEFLEWFDENIYKPMIEPKEFKTVKPDSSEISGSIKKTYKEGFGDDDSLTLDASKFGVCNINDAVELFEKITAL